ncbi:MAG TPA: SMP-30/gluconolactonase/LRE family protein [Ignavibacteriales bacterium]|nr:SMP-30/gluconolactonase/LRE family protein [Ignavibacteriales bacterium]
MKKFRMMSLFFIFGQSILPNYIMGQETGGSFKSPELEKVASGLKFPEGPAWNGKDILYASNCYGDWITRIQGDKVDAFVQTPSKPYQFEKTNGLTVYEDGSVFACEYGKGAIIRFSPDGSCTAVSEGFEGKRFKKPNDLAFAPNGDLYFTDPLAYDKNNLDGVIYRISSDFKTTTPVYSNLGFPNGIAFSADGKFAYVCESAFQRIIRFPVKDDGTFGDFTVFIDLPGGDPDGIAFDTEGNLYAAHFGGGGVYVISPDGKIKGKIPTPGKKPSNVEFAGDDMKTLYITEDETNSIYKTRVEVPGLRLFHSPGAK